MNHFRSFLTSISNQKKTAGRLELKLKSDDPLFEEVSISYICIART